MKGSVLLALVAVLALAPAAVAHDHRGGELRKIDHFVVIYEENHSFDNLYGGWEKVDGLRKADAAHTRQVNQAGAPYKCLLQNDVNLTVAAADGDVHGTTTAPRSRATSRTRRSGSTTTSRPRDTTCPAPGVFAANGVLKGSPARCPAAARATSSTASTRSSTSSTAVARTAT